MTATVLPLFKTATCTPGQQISRAEHLRDLERIRAVYQRDLEAIQGALDTLDELDALSSALDTLDDQFKWRKKS